MATVLWIALGIGGATILGTLAGFLFQEVSHRLSDVIMAFAAGVMLSAAILGLILPSIEYPDFGGISICILGIFSGAMCLSFIDRLVPHVHRLLGWEEDYINNQKVANRVLLFVMAMAIHNFPEGLAAGVSFGSGDFKTAFFIAGGIALQNLPEGLITVTPMLAAGINPRKTMLCGIATGLIEIFGTLFGYYAVSITERLLPFALAFAGGTMLFVVSDEMIPETHDHGNQRAATYSLLFGFCLMLICDVLIT